MMDIEELVERLKIHLQSYAAYNNPDLARTLEDSIYALSTLQAENEKLQDEVEQVKREYEIYRSHLEQLASLPDCNTCDSQNGCIYRPDIGAFTRINCPLWLGDKED